MQILLGWDILMIIWAYYIPEDNLVFDGSHPWSFFIRAFVIKFCCHWALGFYIPHFSKYSIIACIVICRLSQASYESIFYLRIPRYCLSILVIYLLIGVIKYDYIYSSCSFIVLMPLVSDLNTLQRKFCNLIHGEGKLSLILMALCHRSSLNPWCDVSVIYFW